MRKERSPCWWPDSPLGFQRSAFCRCFTNGSCVAEYAKLKALEASFDVNANAISLPETKIEIERIEDAVSHIQFPLTFTDQLYNLRSHIDIVRRKIASRANTLESKAAE